MKPKQPLTARDMETLGELIGAQNSWRAMCARHGTHENLADERGFAPLDFGGSNGSHHGATATKLAGRGLAQERKRGHAWGYAPKRSRGSKVYRPTQAGREAFEIWWQAQRDGGDPVEIMGNI